MIIFFLLYFKDPTIPPGVNVVLAVGLLGRKVYFDVIAPAIKAAESVSEPAPASISTSSPLSKMCS